jgi:DNA-binding NarL/FixJ family response regulator
MTSGVAQVRDRVGRTVVLIVDDHALLADGLASALDHDAFDAHVVEDLTHDGILDAARRRRPHVVLLDLMVDDSGRSTVGLIGTLRDLGADVLVLTGVSNPAVHGACVEAGAVGVVSKRESFDIVRERILRVTRREPAMQAWERDALMECARRQRRAERERLQPFDRLTYRESAVLASLMDGNTAEQIANDSFVSLATVRTQIRAILTKLGVRSQVAAVSLAHRSNWAPAERG